VTSDKIVRVGGATAFRADSVMAVPQLFAAGVDYLVFDNLAEGSIGAFGQMAARDPAGGFAGEFFGAYVLPWLGEMLAKGTKVITNAGALNPRGCAAAMEKEAAALGFKPRIAFVEGDDLRHRAEEFRAEGFRDMFSGAPFPDRPVTSINAYIGGFPIATALAKGADIVVTGRVVDSALTLGPLIHEFGWSDGDLDLLAAGTVAGHLLECGAQATGGTFTDWRDVPDWAHIGYPIGECRADGGFVMTKPEGTGGLVSVGTVAEQMLYEVSDPAAYFVPDVTVDFTGVKLEQVGPNRVSVTGARGHRPTATAKVSVTYEDGWRAIAIQPIMGIDAPAKAERQAAALFERTADMLRARNLPGWKRTHVELLGAEATYGSRARRHDTREVILRMIADHDERAGAELFAREQVSAITTMSVGTSIGLGGSVAPILNLFSFLLPKDRLQATMTLDGVTEPVAVPMEGGYTPQPAPQAPPSPVIDGERTEVQLVRLAYGRSGDKGDLFNVGIIARKPEYLPHIRAALTPDAVAAWFAHAFSGAAKPRVDRYEVPGIHALNFVLHEALDGGITASPRLDKVAKAMAQQLLEFPVPVPRPLADALTS
jgi:hypothetical protein